MPALNGNDNQPRDRDATGEGAVIPSPSRHGRGNAAPYKSCPRLALLPAAHKAV